MCDDEPKFDVCWVLPIDGHGPAWGPVLDQLAARRYARATGGILVVVAATSEAV